MRADNIDFDKLVVIGNGGNGKVFRYDNYAVKFTWVQYYDNDIARWFAAADKGIAPQLYDVVRRELPKDIVEKLGLKGFIDSDEQYDEDTNGWIVQYVASIAVMELAEPFNEDIYDRMSDKEREMLNTVENAAYELGWWDFKPENMGRIGNRIVALDW